MNINRAGEPPSASDDRRQHSRTRSSSEGRDQGERTPRPSISREDNHSPLQFDEHLSRSRVSSSARHANDQEVTRLLSRDFGDQDHGTHRLRHVRSTAISFRQPSIRRRLGSTQPSPSPGPSRPWRFMDSDQRSFAIAPTATDYGDTASRKFSLAGPAPFETLYANQPYVDPGYTQLNPAYDQPANSRPVWSLAKPLPHVLRPGMVPTKDELKREVSKQEDETEHGTDLESGRIEPSFRPGKIAAQLDDVRRQREMHLYETFHQHQNHYFAPNSQESSPFARPHRGSPAPNRIPDIQHHFDEPIIEEDEDIRHRPSDPELNGLSEAVSKVNKAKQGFRESKLPYQDAIPLSSYEAEEDEVHNLHTYWSVIRLRFREPLAEMLGIMILYTLGFSVNLSLTASRGMGGSRDTADWAWGFAVMTSIYVAGGVSGAHFNPAISTMLYIYRGWPISKMPSYLVGQLTGAFLATLITFTIFRPGLLALEARELALQGESTVVIDPQAMPHASNVLANFLIFPRFPWVDTWTAFLTEVLGATILSVSVLALGDDTNAPPGAGMNAFIVGLLIVALGMCLGKNTGLGLNPVRDFGPRVALTMLGYGKDPYPSLFADGYWFKVNFLAPFTGAILGGFIYDSFIFIGGESPVNYPAERVRRAAWKFIGRCKARFGRAKSKFNGIKDEVVG